MRNSDSPRDHGGDLDAAQQCYGGAPGDWIDLSTGINPVPYPLPPLPTTCWTRLPTRDAMAMLEAAAQGAYHTDATIIPCPGAQAAIQVLPYRLAPGRVAILSPTYNEYAGCFAAAGWAVDTTHDPADLGAADVGVVVSPNNPDGRMLPAATLCALAEKLRLLIVDESFADARPADALSVTEPDWPENIIVLRSLGKFYGLAGLRVGFALARGSHATWLRQAFGPWPISGPAITIAGHALSDADWADAARARLDEDSKRLDALARRCGWLLVGGTSLFRTYETTDARRVQAGLAQSRIWSRRFPYKEGWLRLGLPEPTSWERLEAACAAFIGHQSRRTAYHSQYRTGGGAIG